MHTHTHTHKYSKYSTMLSGPNSPNVTCNYLLGLLSGQNIKEKWHFSDWIKTGRLIKQKTKIQLYSHPTQEKRFSPVGKTDTYKGEHGLG